MGGKEPFVTGYADTQLGRAITQIAVAIGKGIAVGSIIALVGGVAWMAV